jgi:hypothetical protein
MAQEYSANSSENEASPMALLSFGETVIGLQKELLQARRRLNRIWLERMQVEVALWTRLVSDLASSKSDTDVLKACTGHAIHDPGPKAELDFDTEDRVTH